MRLIRDCADACPEPHDDAGRFSAGAELLQPAGIVAPPIDDARFPDAGIYQRIAGTLEDGKIQMAFLMTAWRFPIFIQATMPRRLPPVCARSRWTPRPS
jgi:hypothetical protein